MKLIKASSLVLIATLFTTLFLSSVSFARVFSNSSITVTKVVVGNGAFQPSDFPLFVGDTQVVSGETNPYEAGTYSIHESSHVDFTPSFSGDCVPIEYYEARVNSISDLRAKKQALQTAIAETPEDPSAPTMQAQIVDIDAKILALLNSLSADISLGAEANAQCTITNTYVGLTPEPTGTGKIKVLKITIGGNGTFNFTGDAGDFSVTTSRFSGSTTISNLLAGTYSISETAQSGWKQIANSCRRLKVSDNNTKTCVVINKYERRTR